MKNFTLITMSLLMGCQTMNWKNQSRYRAQDSSKEAVETSSNPFHPANTAAPILQSSTPDPCCAHWLADGKCAHELIPGCSNSP